VTSCHSRCFLSWQSEPTLSNPAKSLPPWIAKPHFFAKQVQAGRSLGSRQSRTDILSPATQLRWGFQVQSLAPRRAAEPESWQEAVVDNTQTSPADAAAFRLDFRHWLASLTPRNRQLVDLLMHSYTPTQAARQLKISRGRISQLRKAFARRWYASQEEPFPEEPAALPAPGAPA
jgi:hypothetical protein